jgi:stage II sporulation protein D
MNLRIVNDVVEAIVYEPLPGVAAADRYSPVAHWDVRLAASDLDQRVASLGIGRLEDLVVLERGPSGRVVTAELRGSGGTTTVTGPRLRTLMGLRDSMVYVEESRNARRELIGLTFYGGGWGHGVGMCQVGAFGMAMDGASARDILLTYYTGIDIEKLY